MPLWTLAIWIPLASILLVTVMFVVLIKTGAFPTSPVTRKPFRDSMAWNTYQATMPKGPHQFLLTCKLSKWFFHGPEEWKTTHYSISMGKGVAVGAYAYVARDSDLGKQLFSIMQDGQDHLIALEVHYEGADSNHVKILKVLLP
jgi:hypothetical protein